MVRKMALGLKAGIAQRGSEVQSDPFTPPIAWMVRRLDDAWSPS